MCGGAHPSAGLSTEPDTVSLSRYAYRSERRSPRAKAPSLASHRACEVLPGSVEGGRGRGHALKPEHCACPVSQLPEPSVWRLPCLCTSPRSCSAAGVPGACPDPARRNTSSRGKVVVCPWGSLLSAPQLCDTRWPYFYGGHWEWGPFCSFYTRLGLRPEGMMAFERLGHWDGGFRAKLRKVHCAWTAATGSEAFWTRERRSWGQLAPLETQSYVEGADFL